MAVATEPTKRKPPKLFSVTGDAIGIRVELSKATIDSLQDAADKLFALSGAAQFPKSGPLSEALTEFLDDPTAKVETKP